MSSKRTSEGDVNAALALTADGCNQYLLDKAISKTCPACGLGPMALVTNQENAKPLIVASPIAPTNEAALWYINLVCENCGYSMFINVSNVTEHLARIGAMP